MRTLLFLFAFLPVFVFAQTKIDAASKTLFQNSGKTSGGSDVYYRTIKGTEYLPLLALVNDQYSKAALSEGIIEGSRSGNIISLYVRRDIIKPGFSVQGITYMEWAKPVQPLLDEVIPDVRADSVHQGINLPQPFTGKDVLIGITDWGFDYTHPMFYDTLLTHTRIVKAWDQFRTGGPAPTNYPYGAEFSGETELLTAQCDTFNIYEYHTHGSHVAGIAGGSGAGTIYRGVAFEAGYLFTTFQVDAAAVLDAYNWMKESADAEGKRLVINQSWGLYYMGNLDGTSLLSQAIDGLSAQGVVFVSSAGNNGDANFHIQYNAGNNDTLKTEVQFDNYGYYSNMWGQCLTIWGEPGNHFMARFKVVDGTGAVLDMSDYIDTDTLSYYLEDSLFIGSDTILYNVMCDSANAMNQRPFMQLRVARRNTAQKIVLEIFADTGTVHAWNVIELTNGVGNWGSDFLATFSGYSAGDANYGVGEPACAHSAIAVAAYRATFYHPTTGQPYGGDIAYYSSYGPLIDGTMKPDIAAPGSGVVSSISSFTNAYVSPVASVSFGGRTYPFASFSGTSMSSPVVTGIVALMLDADSTLTVNEIDSILKITSREDDNTGDLSETGDTHWGWGKVNAIQAIYAVLGVQGIREASEEMRLRLYPNPATDFVHVLNPEGITIERCLVLTSDGRLVKEAMPDHTGRINVSDLAPGLYYLQVFSKEGVGEMPLMKD
ncbi:MAG: hypothetical protein C0592_10385 [Marinilabiliales bacterium]|nr:MAG: hypothetical protein C0592_10385 [Marinilabiliales bacterium]